MEQSPKKKCGAREEEVDQRIGKAKTLTIKKIVDPNTTQGPSQETSNSKEVLFQEGEESFGGIKRSYYNTFLPPKASSTKNTMYSSKDIQFSSKSKDTKEQDSRGLMLCCDLTAKSDVIQGNK